jgi:hypothetical protein
MPKYVDAENHLRALNGMMAARGMISVWICRGLAPWLACRAQKLDLTHHATGRYTCLQAVEHSLAVMFAS